MVNLVISDLKALRKVSDRDDIGFIDMVDVVERCYLDLQRVSLEGEMNSISIVSMIEKLLPRIQKREWILLVDGIDDKRALFPELLKFLRCERRVIDYSESTVRSSKAESVAACNVMSTDNAEELRYVDMVKRLQDDQKNINRMLEEMRLQFACNTLQATKGNK